LPAINPQEHIDGGKGNPFISVNEGVIDSQTFNECRRLLNDVSVVARLRPEQR
jgi:hypothetical protein